MALARSSDLQLYIVKDAKPTGVVLGTGSYGSVLEFRISGASCAGKKLHDMLLDAQDENFTANRFKHECQLLASLRHPNIVQFLGLAFLPDSLLPCLLMERLPNSLDDYLENRRNIPLSIKRSILLDVSSGLVYLHGHDPPVIHRDLTSKNVLLTPSLKAKLADLGNSRFIDKNRLSKTMTTAPGTSVYMPPEAFDSNSHYSPKLDIFSFGHLSLYVLTETFPCDLLPPNKPDPKNQEKLIARTEVQRRDVYFTILKSKLSGKEYQPLVRLVEQCLHNYPGRRPTGPELQAHFETLPVPVDNDDDPHTEMMESLQQSHIYETCETRGEQSTSQAREKIGRLSWQKSSAKRGKRSPVILKIAKGRQLQILNENKSKPLEQVELSDVDSIETVSEKDFHFEVHFRDKKKSPWEFGALTEEEHSSWIEAITCLLPEEPLYHQEKKKGMRRNKKANQEKEKEKEQKEKYENVYHVSDKWSTPPLVAVQPPEQARPVVNPKCGHNVLSPACQEELHYAITRRGDIPSNPRPRSYEINAIPIYVKPDQRFNQPQGRTGCSLTEPNNVYEVMDKVNPTATPDSVYLQPNKHREDRPKLQLPINEDVSTPRMYKSPSSSNLRASPAPANRVGQHVDSMIMPISPVRRCQFFDPVQMSILQQMLQQTQEYLLPECKKVPFQASNTYLHPDSDPTIEYNVPEDMLITEEDIHLERPQWAKPSITPVSGVTGALSRFEEESLTISPYSLHQVQEIGRGQFGKVYKAFLLNVEGKSIEVAMKTIKTYSEDEMRSFKKEMAVMSKMMHPNIVQLYGLLQEGEFAPSIVLEFQPHGDLKAFLMKNERSQRQLMKYMVDVAMGMHYISEKGLVHRDLAARNVLVGINETCKISDFGLCELLQDISSYTSQSHVPCPVRWMAPESILKREFSTASDVWSYGVLQWEMYNPSKKPYPNMDNNLCSINVCHGYTLPIPRMCPSIVAKIMKSCWLHNPASRPSFFLIATTLSKATL